METVGEARLWLKEKLSNLFSAEELPEIQFLILNLLTGFSQTQIHAFPETQLSVQQIAMLLLSVQKLETGMPIQYVLGEAHFFGLKFNVDPSVLIPRPETEELVAWVLEEKGMRFGGKGFGGKGLEGERFGGKGFEGTGFEGERFKGEEQITDRSKLIADSPHLTPHTSHLKPHTTYLLDIGTGSGCIPIAIKKNWPQAVVSGMDISAEALQTAQQNALQNQVDITFFRQDILNFNPVKEASKYHIVVSNPPYITPSEQKQMHTNVIGFEPHLALFVPESDPLLFYRAIAVYAAFALEKNGLLYLEINEKQGAETALLLKQNGFTDIRLRQDFYGKDRMIRATKN